MKIEVIIPSKLSDIKTSQYQKFLRTTKDVEDANFIAKQMVGIFCNLPDDLVNKLTKRSFDDILKELEKILNVSEAPLQRVIKHNGKKYGFIPNMDKMTVGEMADLDSYIKDFQKMHLALGVMYRPIVLKKKDKYIIEDYKEGSELDLPLDVMLGASFFFQNLMIDLLNYSQNSILEHLETNKRFKTLVENGAGINQFTESLRATFLNLKMQLN